MMYLLIFILQFSGLILAFVLEDLSSKKMGVARYLQFKRQEFDTSFFTPVLNNIYTIFFIAGAILCIVLLIIKGKSRKIIISLLFGAIVNIIGILLIQSKLEWQASHFFLIGMFILVFFQYFWIFRSFYKNKV